MMDKQLNVFLVTGAAGGIGQATVRAMASADRRIVCIDVDSNALKTLPTSLPGEILAVQSNLDSSAECERVVMAAGGRIAGLVHLAGILDSDLQIGADPTHWDRVINANLRNAYHLTGVVMEHLDDTQQVRMVFTTSLAFRRGAPENVAYAVAKGGIVGLTRSLAKRLGSRGLVNAVSPGIIETRMPAEFISRHRDRLIGEIPLRRFGHPDEVAQVIAFLMSRACTYLTGQVINIDGGMVNS